MSTPEQLQEHRDCLQQAMERFNMSVDRLKGSSAAVVYVTLLEREVARLHELYDVSCDHCMDKHEPPKCDVEKVDVDLGDNL